MIHPHHSSIALVPCKTRRRSPQGNRVHRIFRRCKIAESCFEWFVFRRIRCLSGRELHRRAVGHILAGIVADVDEHRGRGEQRGVLRRADADAILSREVLVSRVARRLCAVLFQSRARCDHCSRKCARPLGRWRAAAECSRRNKLTHHRQPRFQTFSRH